MVQVTSHTKHYWRTFDKKVKQFNQSSQLPEYFTEMITGKKSVKIAEVCSGLVNTIGDSWPSKRISVVCSDSNAISFNSMWQEKGIKPLHPIEYQDVESMSYAENSFDIVHCRNALDHTEDPLRAISEMKRVTKDWVYLIHAPDQMDIYGGHHMWNIKEEQGQTIFYGKEYSIVLDSFTTFINHEGLIVSIWRK